MSKYFPFDLSYGIFEQSYTVLIKNSIKISHRILFNCASVLESLLALGCNTGNIYVFGIENNKFRFYSNIITNDTPVDNILFSPSKLYIAYSNIKFQIYIYKLNFTHEINQLVRQIDSSYNSPICSFLWDEDSSRLFCGYKHGYIDSILVPQQVKDIFLIPSENICKLDKQFIGQMDLIKDTLLVSTNEKVILINLQTKFFILIGTKPRLGQYGACFWYGKEKILKVIAARPNYRLWIASIDGTVEETQQYKNWTHSPKHKIGVSDEDLQSTGQFSWLSPIKDNLVFAGDSGGLIFIINLYLKLCLKTIDCGPSLSKIIFSNHGVLILNSQKEITNVRVLSTRDALHEIISENVDSKQAIDLFLSLSPDLAVNQMSEFVIELRNLFNSLTPNLLATIVEKAAELSYRFVETNKLQVYITDNDEYQRIYYSNESENNLQTRTSNTSSTNVHVESSSELSIESDNSVRSSNKIKASDKFKDMIKGPNILKAIYDTTSKLLAQIDPTSSSNNELQLSLLDSLSDRNSDESKENSINVTYHSDRTLEEKVDSKINLMELEANVYIAWESLKNLSKTDEEIFRKTNFSESLANFCQSWLILNLHYWIKLYFDKLCILNLSATFPNFSTKSKEGLQVDNRPADHFITEEEQNYLYCNSWCNPIQNSQWLKHLPITEKISFMTSTLLSCCFSYGTFALFPDLIIKICEITNICGKEKKSIDSVNNSNESDNINDTLINDKSIQTDYEEDYCMESKAAGKVYRFPELLEKLNNEIWPNKTDYLWIRSMILLFHSVTNLKDLRGWMVSCLSQNIWLDIFDCFKEIYSNLLSKEEYQFLSNKSQLDLDQLLFNCLCLNTIESLILTDKILGYMEKLGHINWRIIVESENLDCRDVLHLSIKHDLDLTDYILYLFSSLSVSTKFYTRNHLIDHIYSQSDVLISLVYMLLNNVTVEQKNQNNICHTCGMITNYSDSTLPDNIYQIVIEILKRGSQEKVFMSDKKVLEMLIGICISMGFHQGYIELLVGSNDVKNLITIGIQTSNIKILQRIKDCNIVLSNSLKQIFEILVYLRRKQIKKCCLKCDQLLENDISVTPLPWIDIGNLIFNDLLQSVQNRQELQRSIINILNDNELEQIKGHLVVSIKNIVNSKKVTVKDQMFHFINAEMNNTSDSSKLTEMYLNIYSMNHSELCGSTWGKIITQNMLCNACGCVLISRNSLSENQEIISFTCDHSFHKKCLEDVGCECYCFLC